MTQLIWYFDMINSQKVSEGFLKSIGISRMCNKDIKNLYRKLDFAGELKSKKELYIHFQMFLKFMYLLMNDCWWIVEDHTTITNLSLCFYDLKPSISLRTLRAWID